MQADEMKTAPACILFRIPPSSCGGQFRGTSGVTFIRARRGQFTQEFPGISICSIFFAKLIKLYDINEYQIEESFISSILILFENDSSANNARIKFDILS